jgi:hypothetical protein
MNRLEARTAIEALRAGVPNRAAIRLMGTGETGIENAFDALLQSVWSPDAAPRPGLGLAGGFGAGKSHLLGYLAEVARTHNFVVSRVVVSKETPLADPARVFEAAVGSAVVPDRNDDAIGAALARLRAEPERLEALERDIVAPGSGLAGVFGAILLLMRRPGVSPEALRRCERFLSGGRMTSASFKQALAAVGAARMFDLRMPAAADLTPQRIDFASRMFRAAGYAGWCLLLDEVELIGRYTPLQRSMAYAWLATWLGLDGASGFRGIAAAYAITDDFVAAVIEARQDEVKLAERLRLKGRRQEAELAVAAMRHIQDTVRRHRLPPPGLEELARDCLRLREIYECAYDWRTPEPPPPERTATRTMRQYIKAWITQWDMQRLIGASVGIVERAVDSNYDEDAGLGEAEAEGSEGQG